jgi:DNA polymerase (family 10)
VDNPRIAFLFDELADLLDISGENHARARGYREVADRVRTYPEALQAVAARGGIRQIPGVTKALEAKLIELLATGTFPALDQARVQIPASLRELLRVPGLGPRTVRTLWQQAGVTSLSELAYACEENHLAPLTGFSVKKQGKILATTRFLLEGAGNVLLVTALDLASRLARLLPRHEVVAVGEARRGHEVVRDLVILVRGGDGPSLANEVDMRRRALGVRSQRVLGGGNVEVTLDGGLRARLHAVDEAEWIHALVVETGSPAHVRWLEEKTQHGFEALCASVRSEQELYAELGLPYAPPELRDSPTPVVPTLLSGVRGVFHNHTNWSDGTASILQMARAAVDAGYEYIGISDHSKAASYANGLGAERLAEQAQAIAIARRERRDIAILHGVEVDILADGTLDLDNLTLAELDFVVASIHTRFGQSPSEMTARLVRAVSHPLVTMLGHPTGRLLLGRAGYDFDLETVVRAAKANDTYLEINANPQRLDLSDVNARRARALGGRFAINPDAHAPRGVGDASLGVTVARRAGLCDVDVLNAVGVEDVQARLSDRKADAVARLGLYDMRRGEGI